MIKKRTTTNLVLFSCVIILSLIIHFNPLKPAIVDTRLTAIQKSDITTLTIQRPAQVPIMLHRKDQWYLTQPINIKANQARIENILNIVDSTSITRFSLDEIDLNEFALGASPVTLTLNQTIIKFGDTDPIDQQRYVLVDKTLHLIDDIVYPIITSNIGSLIDNKLLLNIDDIDEFTLDLFSITKSPDGQWNLNHPNSSSVTPSAITDWLERWQEVHATYITQQTPPNGQEQKIQINSAHGAVEFLIINDSHTSGLYRKDLALMYHISDDVLKQLISLP